MSSFADREKAFESKFAHDQDMQFKAEARRNKLIAHWAASVLEKSPDETKAYVAEVIAADFEEAGDEDVFRKVSADLSGKVDAQDVRDKLASLMIEAKSQLMDEN